MIESPHLLEQALGMAYYTTDTPGIGGVLRTFPEDFRVEELPFPVSSEGRYLVCRLTKRDWELQRLVKELARVLGISHRRIAWAGTKDKHAVTVQLITLYDVEPAMLERISLKDVSLEVVGRSPVPLTLGMLKGNSFSICIRECGIHNLDGRVSTIAKEVEHGVLNYYGVQRFGVARPLTHLIGKQILLGDYEGAALTYIGGTSFGEPLGTQVVRKEFMDYRDPKRALHQFPVHLSYERAMLHHLSSHKGDYRGALSTLPPKLLSMLVSAFQSYLFNCALSQRCREGVPLTEPLAGDHLLFENDRTDVVTASGLRAAKIHVGKNRARIALFIPGALSEEWNHTSPTVKDLLALHGINPPHFRSAQEFVRTAFHGFYRQLSLKTVIFSVIQGANVQLKFTLGPGEYATTICREFMKSDPVTLV